MSHIIVQSHTMQSIGIAAHVFALVFRMISRQFDSSLLARSQFFYFSRVSAFVPSLHSRRQYCPTHRLFARGCIATCSQRSLPAFCGLEIPQMASQVNMQSILFLGRFAEFLLLSLGLSLHDLLMKSVFCLAVLMHNDQLWAHHDIHLRIASQYHGMHALYPLVVGCVSGASYFLTLVRIFSALLCAERSA